ncbi:MAG: protein arginine kinase [Clostridia bacterium]|nr:protein arginine kinase [Clostridia bacterium]
MAKWYCGEGFQDDIVLSTRVRLARNLKGIPFPNCMSDEDAQKVISTVEDALSKLNYKFRLIRLSDITDVERQRLMEEHFISPQMLKEPAKKAVFLSEDEAVAIMINEEDHIRLQCIYAGEESEKAYNLISKIDDFLGETVQYAFHRKYGHLTACPTNVGTGMRLSFMLHLPALCMARMADNLFAAVGKLGVTVRGMYGEGTKSSGYVFQISNQTTLGKSETELAQNVTDVVNQIIAKEREVRRRIAKDKGVSLEDKIMRSYGIMKYAKKISTEELTGLLSNVRFGASLGIIENVSASTLNEIMVVTRPAHIMETGTETGEERDVKRAEVIKTLLNKKEE